MAAECSVVGRSGEPRISTGCGRGAGRCLRQRLSGSECEGALAMKGTERHHLKENELVAMAEHARRTIGEQRSIIGGVLIAVLVIGGAGVGYVAWRNHTQSVAASLMAEA